MIPALIIAAQTAAPTPPPIEKLTAASAAIDRAAEPQTKGMTRQYAIVREPWALATYAAPSGGESIVNAGYGTWRVERVIYAHEKSDGTWSVFAQGPHDENALKKLGVPASMTHALATRVKREKR